jgi:hypothetical protein
MQSDLAVHFSQWPGKPKCGAFVRIQHGSKKHKSIVVRIVDSCAGCATGSAHLDLTKAAFEKLYDEDVGMVEGLKAKVIPCPSKIEEDWNDDVVSSPSLFIYAGLPAHSHCYALPPLRLHATVLNKPFSWTPDATS